MLNSLNGIKMKVINMVLISVISVRIYCDNNNNNNDNNNNNNNNNDNNDNDNNNDIYY